MSDEIVMVRRDLQDLPVFAMPAGFSLRFHAGNDEAQWTRIQQLADQLNPITPGLFTNQFGSEPGEWARRILYLVDDRSALAVGTAAAWHGDSGRGADWGRVHWVAVIPDYQGRGLSKALLAATLQRLHDLGHTKAYLTTSASRPVALQLYERFGFRYEA